MRVDREVTPPIKVIKTILYICICMEMYIIRSHYYSLYVSNPKNLHLPLKSYFLLNMLMCPRLIVCLQKMNICGFDPGTAPLASQED